MADEGWCTIESDPGVFTELLAQAGVKDVQVEELFSLDEDSLKSLGEVFGIIFLFKWKVPETGAPDSGWSEMDTSTDNKNGESIYFANQVINNACATQAILSIVMNCKELDIGSELSEFKAFSKDFDPTMKGLAISNLKNVRDAHNSFAPNQQIVVEQEKKADKDDDIYHFVSYIPFDGGVYELDGTRPSPIRRGDAGDNWLEACVPIIRSRMEEYSSNEIRFNLMAVVRSRKKLYEEDLAEQKLKLEKLKADSSVDSSAEQSTILANIARLEADLAQERIKLERWRKENVRRKHNYVPFVMELLKLLASKGELNKMIEKAKEEKRKQV